MSVPNTSTFSLQDVVNEINPTTNDLLDCVSDAVSGAYDSAYYTSPATSLLEFRNYGPKTWGQRVEAIANTTTYDYTSDVPANFVCSGLYVNSAGTQVYMLSQSEDKVYQWTMSTAHNLSTISYTGVSGPMTKFWSGTTLIPSGLYFNTSGTRVFSSNNTTSATNGYKMYGHTLSTAWDITTLSNTVTTSCQFSGLSSGGYWQMGDFGFTDDGLKLIVPHNAGSSDAQLVRKYTLSSAWNLSSIVNLGGTNSLTFSSGLSGTNLISAIPMDPSDNTLTNWIGMRLDNRDATSNKYAFEEYSGYSSTTELSYYESALQTSKETISMANKNYLFTTEDTNDILRMYELS